MSRRRFLLSLAPALVAPAWVARAWATTIPRASVVPGGVARIGLGASEQAPRVRLGGDRVLVMREGDDWVAVVGIALSAKPGSKLRVEAEQAGGGVERFEIAVAPKAYASQHLKVPPDQVDLSTEHLTRYERERVHLSEVLRTFTDSPPAARSARWAPRAASPDRICTSRYISTRSPSIRRSFCRISQPRGEEDAHTQRIREPSRSADRHRVHGVRWAACRPRAGAAPARGGRERPPRENSGRACALRRAGGHGADGADARSRVARHGGRADPPHGRARHRRRGAQHQSLLVCGRARCRREADRHPE